MSAPIKSLDAQLDAMIETDIDFWVEDKDREAEQIELLIEEDN